MCAVPGHSHIVWKKDKESPQGLQLSSEKNPRLYHDPLLKIEFEFNLT